MTLDLDTIKKLSELGATAVEIKPDGTIVARFDKPAPAPVQYVPVPYVQPYPFGPFFWGGSDSQLPNAPAFTVATWNEASES